MARVGLNAGEQGSWFHMTSGVTLLNISLKAEITTDFYSISIKEHKSIVVEDITRTDLLILQ